MSAFLNVVDLDSFVALRGHAEFSGVVKIQGQDIWLWLVLVLSVEQLRTVSDCSAGTCREFVD